jgi:DnaJ-class molecular chaperone
MVSEPTTAFDFERACALLGVASSANADELRAAYLRKVMEHPPDRDPEVFEQIRDAYEQLRNPSVRARAVLEGPDPTDPLKNFLAGEPRARAFIGSQLWIDLLKEKRS